jgi:biopolymer transport protein ExbD
MRHGLASYNDVIQVLDLLRDVGGDRVSLATLPGSGDGTSGSNTQVPVARELHLTPVLLPSSSIIPYAAPAPLTLTIRSAAIAVVPGQPGINPTAPASQSLVLLLLRQRLILFPRGRVDSANL